MDHKRDDGDHTERWNTQSDAEDDSETEREFQSSHMAFDAQRQYMSYERAMHRM